MLQRLVVSTRVTGVLGQLNESDFGVMASHEFRTSIGGGIINHRDRRPGIITIPNHRWQALLQQVTGVEIQDDDIYGWGWQNLMLFGGRGGTCSDSRPAFKIVKHKLWLRRCHQKDATTRFWIAVSLQKSTQSLLLQNAQL